MAARLPRDVFPALYESSSDEEAELANFRNTKVRFGVFRALFRCDSMHCEFPRIKMDVKRTIYLNKMGMTHHCHACFHPEPTNLLARTHSHGHMISPTMLEPRNGISPA